MTSFVLRAPDYRDCQIIADKIAEENRHAPHMLPVCADELHDNIQKHGGFAAYDL